MKYLIATLLVLVFNINYTFSQTRNQILKYNIYKVEEVYVDNKSNLKSEYFYDDKGNKMYFLSESSDSTYCHEVYYEYLDSMLIQVRYKTLSNGMELNKELTQFLYIFNSDGEIIESSRVNSNGNVSVYKINYNNKGKIDTSYQYYSENGINSLVLESSCRYEYVGEKAILYCYYNKGWQSDSLVITETIQNDTLQEFIIKSCKVDRGNVEILKTDTIRMTFKNGLQLSSKNSSNNSWSKTDYFEDERGLVYKSITTSYINGKESKNTVLMNYFTRF